MSGKNSPLGYKGLPEQIPAQGEPVFKKQDKALERAAELRAADGNWYVVRPRTSFNPLA